MSEKLLLLGGSAQQVVAIEAAKRLGLRAILCDYLPDNPGQYHAHKFYRTSTTDKDAILKIARDENIQYIIAYASDPAAPTAAFVAEKMGLPTNPLKAVETLCNKDMFREFLISRGFHAPMARGYQDAESAVKGIRDFNLPIIVKPVDSSGSKGVTVLRDLEGLEAAIRFAFSFSRSRRIIVEEFIEKKHPYLIGGDIFVSEGRVIQWGLMNCHRDKRVNPLVPVGKSYPPLLEEADLNHVKGVLQRLVTELGIRFGPMNVELVIDKENRVFPIDVGPRSGGNMIPDLLGMIFDCDEVEMSVRAAMGQSVSAAFRDEKRYFATLNLHCAQRGVFQGVRFSPEIQRYVRKVCVYKKPGEEVEYFRNASDSLGVVFFKFPNQEIMLEMEKNMNKYVKIAVKSAHGGGHATLTINRNSRRRSERRWVA